eukprot:m.136310 g.136310  ORF g.136310 m.136310 type:complete len:80 (+) comp10590_c0_seq1:81-320(+)
MTKATRLDTNKTVGCFPDELLIDTLSKLLEESDGTLQKFEIKGKKYIAGDLQRPVSKFHGRIVAITTESSAIEISISEA